MKLRALCIALGLAFCSPAHAAYVINVQQVGSNVVMTGSGSVNLSALNLFGGGGVNPSFTQPRFGYALIGQSGVSNYWSGFTGPISFGTMNPVYTPATSSTGVMVGIAAFENLLVLPSNYVSGASLATNSSLFENQTFSSMALQEGVYTWNWGAGAAADSFTVQIGQTAPAIPEPATWAMMLLGFAFIGGAMRSHRWTKVNFRLA